MRNILTRAAAFVAAVVFIALFASCGKTYDEAEITSAAASLIEASYEINTIYFGQGLPVIESPDDIFRHYELSEDAPYRTKDEIKDATLAVYTKAYSEFLFEKAFTGFSVAVGEEDSIDSELMIGARYVEYGDRLVMLPLEKDDVMKLDRTYDTSDITVVSQKNGTAYLSVPSFVNGVPDEDVSLTVVRTDDGWRLDTPTY